ncbi:MAG: hypothetical protein KDA85_04810, partial [Planctomycetaceae bacterium]|nr:hypothetical protein [Planctomycetaceae bacterium]
LITRLRETPSDEMRDLLLDARVQLAKARMRFAETGDQTLRDKMLQAASAELATFPRTYRDINDDWWKKLDTAYQDVLAMRGMTPVPLERPEPIIAPPPQPAVVAENTAEKSPESSTTPVAETPTEEGGGIVGTILAIVGLLVAAGAAFAFYKALSKPRARARLKTAPALKMPTPGDDAMVGVEAGSAGGGPDFSALAAAVSSSTGNKTAATRPRQRPAAAADGTAANGAARTEAAAERRPRPRPSSPGSTQPSTESGERKPPAASDAAERPRRPAAPGEAPRKKRPRPPESQGQG